MPTSRSLINSLCPQRNTKIYKHYEAIFSQFFVTKLGKFTNFKMLFGTVAKDLVFLAWSWNKIWSTLHCATCFFPWRIDIKFLVNFFQGGARQVYEKCVHSKLSPCWSTVSKRPETSNRIEKHFSVFNHVSLISFKLRNYV